MGGFTNREKLRSKLTIMPRVLLDAVARQMRANAEELAETQKRFADASFADPTGALQSTIGVRDLSKGLRISFRVSAGGREAPHAGWVEFGTKGHEARAPRQNRNYRRTAILTRAYAPHHATQAKPYFWPAYRLKKRTFKSRVARAAKKAIKGLCE